MRPCPVDKLKRALRPLRRAASRMAGAGAPPRAAHRYPVPVRRACSPGRATAQPAPRLCCPRRLSTFRLRLQCCACHPSVALALPRFACPAALQPPARARCACSTAALHCWPGLRLHSRLSAGVALGAPQHRAAFHVPASPTPRASGSPPPSAATGPRQHPPPVAGVGAVQRLGRCTFRPAARANARQSWRGWIRHAAPAFGGLPVPRLRPARARWLRCRAGARHLSPAPAVQIPGFGASRLSRRGVRNPPPRCKHAAKPSSSFSWR